jgi:hypothetical protein
MKGMGRMQVINNKDIVIAGTQSQQGHQQLARMPAAAGKPAKAKTKRTTAIK